MVGIYRIINPKGKIYVGQTWDLTDRKNTYSRYNCKGQRKLYNSLKKYGWEQHIFEILEICSDNIIQTELDILEIYYLQEAKKLGEVLNIRDAGSRGKLSEESKKLISQNRNHKSISEKLKGRIISEETREKIRQKALGKSKGKGVSRNKGRKITWVNKIVEKKTGMKYNKKS